MKKTILSILAGATMLSSAAFASPALKIDATDLVLPTGDQVISDLYNQNVGGINNVSLSKYEQAWMIVHDKDTMFKHKTFWVRTGKLFTGIAVDSLKDLNKNERSDFIKNEIISNAVLTELTNQIEMAEKTILDLQAQFGVVGAEVERLGAALAAEITSKAELVAAHEAVVEGINAGHSIAIAAIDNTDYQNEHHAFVSGQLIGAESRNAEIATLEATIAELNAEIAAGGDFTKEDIESALVLDQDGTYDLIDLGVTVSVITNTDGSVNYVEINNIQNVVTAGNDDAFNQGKANGIALGKANAEDNPINDSFDETVPSFETHTGSKSVTAYTSAMVDGSTTVYSITVDSVEVGTIISTGFVATNDLISDGYDQGFADGYADGFAEGYNQGFSDGYEQGYEQGYNDGFSDGVASVR